MSTRAEGTHMAGYELITTAPCPANGRLPRSGQPPGGTTDDGAAATTRPDYAHGETGGAFADGSAKGPVLREGRRTRPCPRRYPRRPVRAASTGRTPDRARLGPARRGKRRSHPSCTGCTRRGQLVPGHAASITRSPPIAGGGTTPSGRLVSSARAGVSTLQPFPSGRPAPSASRSGCAGPAGTP
jgi:hypothetical protein